MPKICEHDILLTAWGNFTKSAIVVHLDLTV